jgi:hypothetical protein
MINNYMPIFNQFRHAQFVTLTRPNVTAEQLPSEINDLIDTFKLMIHYLRGTPNKKKQIHAKGLRKLEVTYNWRENTYHPHFHLLVDTPGSARAIIKEWLFRNPEASEAAQYFREADSGSFTELFKYAAKIVVDKDMSIYAKDIIFQSLNNHRIYQPFGINKITSEDVEEIVSQAYGMLNPEAYKVWYFNNSEEDWNSLEGESLIETLFQFDTS